MKITIKDKEIQLNNREVRSAKRLVSNFLDSVRSASKEKLCPTYYFTLLIIMHTMSQSLINEIDADTFQDIMSKLSRD